MSDLDGNPECAAGQVEREEPQLEGVGEDWLDVPDPEVSFLVEFPTRKYPLTERQDTDVHTAITHGLANYLLDLDGAIAGRSCMLQSVVPDWADHATGQRPLPSAAVYSTEEGDYKTDSGLSVGKPLTIGTDRGQMVTVTGTGNFELEVRVDVMCPDKVLRAGVRRMLEQGFSPVTWMAGFRLVLPRYHSAVASFLLLAAAFPDSELTAQQSLWPLRLRLRAHCPTYRPHVLPLARPIASGTIT